MDWDKHQIELLHKLADLAKRGPIPCVGLGSKSVGLTLSNSLGISNTSLSKATFKGIRISTSTRNTRSNVNRINLFAKVPDWNISACKSSKEIVKRYGYEVAESKLGLFCTVRTRIPNSQGLFLQINRSEGHLEEQFHLKSNQLNVARWDLATLKDRLILTNGESVWVRANKLIINGDDYYHYREAIFTSSPDIDQFEFLIEAGGITVDHLITLNNNIANEKGPLFKIHPDFLDVLFPEQKKFDLMSF